MPLTISTAAPSPCVKICMLDAAGRVCLGCHRTIDEITTWSRLSDEVKRNIIARIAADR
jgi:predicted Fe-S protein YdhL (DUF1289 family)